MNLSNWVYLGIGLVVGVSFQKLLSRPKTQQQLQSEELTVKTTDNPENLEVLQQQIKNIQLAYHMAEQMGQFKSGFLARTTHVLRSPLNGLIGLHQLILSDLCEDPAEEREFVAQAHERALKLLKLIDEILGVARIEYGVNKLDIQPLSLAHVLQEVYDMTYMLAENRNFPLKMSALDPEVYILADPKWLRQVLVSQLDSTIAMIEAGNIQISAATNTEDKFAYIYFDVPLTTIPDSEPIDLLKSPIPLSPEASYKDSISPGMKLFINQTLLETMGGKLELVAVPEKQQSTPNLSRLQISIPRLTPEA
ncbi:sensor histidine kinase [Calothrix sp. 336/3]|uniref:sensor histidine kinase n=1 Tax=Calothrix sp. 336/3 TaxID=1337936 RepID=UPI0004E4034F|nr:HAMP domain-containing sensor histidine kinase [Calothrix sp. 336/3]AKG23530.1 histidine kinase [Calothrix sp. 336/3]